ncbi:glycoside hydrolase family 9 protein [Clostridium sp. BNL1100]|uniref:glycoside hydrolase family 9 protein n=1 Tax=Clostridium sp. BNL1100 TaxID=755731 RepID=UPI00024A77F3|nr:glycoside hydrolase family 9 protein [Clostridium sp. BNL1100]AEY66061.1 dockerin-like protein [Clostridium sp. BNL1100]
MNLISSEKKRKIKAGIACFTISGILATSGGIIPGILNQNVYAASTSPGDYQQDSRIRLNSIGYLPEAEKKATIAASSGDFIVVNSSGTAVLTGKTTTVYDSDTNEQVSIADFSQVKTEGSYTLLVPGIGKSVTFKIDPNIYLNPFKTTMLGMYLWRCGTSVSATYNGKVFSHEACHTKDAYTDYINGQHNIKDGGKGWHDAGDYNKYVVNAGITLGSMFFAWEQFKDQIKDISLTMPESNNSMPDYLDELKYETDWLLTMQYPDGSGKVSHKLSTKDFGGFVLPERETADRFFTSWGSSATADFVAMMAMASRAFRPYDAAYADKCIAAAKVSYTFLKANPGNTKPDQSAFTTGAYDTTDTDDRLWAAAEMWETTGDSSYLADFEASANTFTKKIDVDFDWGNVNNLGMFTYLLSEKSGKNTTLYNTIKNALISVADSIVATADGHGYGRPLGATYYWGCNGTVARQTMILNIANKLSPKSEYVNTSLDALNFLFGRNYYDRSFVTGLGLNPPMYPHDRRSGGDSLTDPWPGYLVGGGWPGAKDWKDNQESYQTNEIAINWNGALIYALAASLDISDTPDALLGDINMDAKVDAIDYALLKQYILGLSNLSVDALRSADVNHDNTVDALDLSILKQYLLGKITSL